MGLFLRGRAPGLGAGPVFYWLGFAGGGVTGAVGATGATGGHGFAGGFGGAGGGGGGKVMPLFFSNSAFCLSSICWIFGGSLNLIGGFGGFAGTPRIGLRWRRLLRRWVLLSLDD
jgi:hypothetical protein